MFTGLIEQQGIVVDNETGALSNRLIIRAPLKALVPGESISINGFV